MNKPEPKRVLRVIDRLCYVFCDSPKTLKDAKKIISQIYRFAHLFSDCENPHNDWREEFYKVGKEIRKERL